MIGAAQFHASPGVSDWWVVMSGVCAVFRAPSLAVGSRLVPSVVSATKESGVQPDLDLRPEAVVVRVPLGDDGVPAGCAGFAATVSTAAGSLALVPDPSLIRSVDLYVAEHSLTPTREFWSAALGYVPSGDTDAVDPLRRGPSPLPTTTASTSRAGSTRRTESALAGRDTHRFTRCLSPAARSR